MPNNPYNQDDSSAELCRQILQTARAGQDEIEAAVNAPFLFQRIRNQIATEGNVSHQTAVAKHRNLFSSFFASFNWRWGWAIPATAVILFGFVMVATRSNSGGNKPNEIVVRTSPAFVPPTPIATQAGGQVNEVAPRNTKVIKAAYHPRTKLSSGRVSRPSTTSTEAAEAVTDFLPLTYLSETAAADSGHVVRVEVPRTMMASMGVLTNRERHAEFVKADVIIGDDGLARAIRFVQ
jgi:hypothetical protein